MTQEELKVNYPELSALNVEGPFIKNLFDALGPLFIKMIIDLINKNRISDNKTVSVASSQLLNMQFPHVTDSVVESQKMSAGISVEDMTSSLGFVKSILGYLIENHGKEVLDWLISQLKK